MVTPIRSRDAQKMVPGASREERELRHKPRRDGQPLMDTFPLMETKSLYDFNTDIDDEDE